MDRNTPVIKLHLEGMSHSIIHALTEYEMEISSEVKKAVNNVVKNFDYEAKISKIATEAMESSISNYFLYGDGKQAIQKATTTALNKIMDKE